ncbi:hypothetical protein [Salinicola sp. MIT1003]|uniref:hypothetical protein n=1 Tax=Salinicola sp. MIT1003 TaxID=1882734 RepID=UPI0008DD571F|nr:hypothetical protein [Salinicola sp. MIT1003]OHZ02987.1 hypothetical protein BC443_14960 [Salinicola sp. MIT1003]
MNTTTLIAVALAFVAGSAMAQEASESTDKTGYEETVEGTYVDLAYCRAEDFHETVMAFPDAKRDRIVDVCIDIQTGGPEGRF